MRVTFNSNTVLNNIDGFYLEPETGFTLDVTANFNRSRRTTPTLRCTQASGAGYTGTLNGAMENNWWGCNAGPNNAGCGAVVGAGVDFNPWIVLKASATPGTINAFATSTLTADMTYNSDNVVPAGTLPQHAGELQRDQRHDVTDEWHDHGGPGQLDSSLRPAPPRARPVRWWIIRIPVLPSSIPTPTPTPAPVTIVVKPSAMNGWYFWNDFNDTFTGSPGAMVVGPATPPLGTGSVELGPLTTAAGATGQSVIATDAYFGTGLANLTNLGYSTYQPGPTLAIALMFDVRYRTTDSAYGGRLVFEPYQNGAVTVGSGWQTWSPLSGTWWATKTNAAGTGGAQVVALPAGNCSQSTPCTWAQINAAFPAAQVYGRFLLKAGSNWSGFDGNADALTVGVNYGDTTYDFEPDAPTPSPTPTATATATDTPTPTATATATDTPTPTATATATVVPCTTVCYVDDATGNDANGGDSAGDAKKTIQAAVTQVLREWDGHRRSRHLSTKT